MLVARSGLGELGGLIGVKGSVIISSSGVADMVSLVGLVAVSEETVPVSFNFFFLWNILHGGVNILST